MMDKFNFALLGHNIEYSKSTEIFQAIFDELGIEGKCFTYDMEPETLGGLLNKIKEDDINGLSVTIPHKIDVIPSLDELDPVANLLNAVNSIAVKDGKLTGYNTDIDGFSYPLDEYSQKIENGTALIFGSGGSAKAVIYGLYHDYNIRNFINIGRDINRLDKFEKDIETFIEDVSFQKLLFDDPTLNKIIEYNVIVNCTPLGGWNYSDQSPFRDNFNFKAEAIYYDLNYNEGNKIIEQAKDSSMITINGSKMLVAQALRSFYLWSEIEIEFEKIYNKLF